MEVDDGGGLVVGGVTPNQRGTQLDDTDKTNLKNQESPNDNKREGKENDHRTLNDFEVIQSDDKNLDNVDGKCQDDSGVSDSVVNGKKRRNRRKQKGGKHHRKWKPYDKLTWDERKNLEDKEAKRACKKRESRFASGQAMAPYNTTQFLMEQHEPSEGEFHLEENNHSGHAHPGTPGEWHPPHHDTSSGNLSVSGASSSEENDSNEEEIFLEKDFTEAYEQYHAERLQSLTKEDLIKEHLQLEEEVESLKKQLKSSEDENRRNSSGSSRGSHADISLDDVTTIQAIELLRQVKKLKEENQRLKSEQTDVCEMETKVGT